ncbi:MAG: maleylpyruvate isomerase family mycothiol-dependent enzyme [Acidimicrobiales bacterium]
MTPAIPGPNAAGEEVVGHLSEVWASFADACRDVDEAEWSLPTDCPGWTVRDQMSHVIGVERMLLGEPAPGPLGEVPEYVRNPMGEINEPWLEARRHTPGPEVLAEFVATTQRRLDELRALPKEKFDEIGWSPIGQVPYREFMGTRLLDSWAHEQDARRALGRPGGRNGAGETLVLDRCSAAMTYVVGKKVGAPDGTTVVFEVKGPLGRQVPISVEGGRATIMSETPADPTVIVATAQDVFWRLGFGRIAPGDVLESGEVEVAGDAGLGRQILAAMNFMI